MARTIITGIDVGTSATRVVIAELEKGRVLPRIIGTGIAESKGLRHGYVVNRHEAAESIELAIRMAEKSAGVRVKNALISVGGISLESITSHGTAVVSRADSEVTELDVEKAMTNSEENVGSLSNKHIIQSVPLQFILDGKEVYGRPEGMRGSKLEVKTLLVTCLDQHLRELVQSIEDAGIDVEHIVAAPIAASLVALTRRQRTVGCALVNIGAETVSLVVFEEDLPITLGVFNIGSSDITSDIALGLRIPLEEAEEIKVSGANPSQYPKRKLDEIIEARLSDIFELIEAQLKKISRNGLLPAGIVITGKGAGIATIDDLARAVLQLPSTRPSVDILHTITPVPQGIQDSSWFVAYGLCIFGATQRNGQGGIFPGTSKIGQQLKSWLKQLLP